MPKVVVLPSNVEAERVVLGSMLISEDAVEIAAASLEESDFSDADPRNKLIYEAMKKLRGNGKPIDPQTVYDMLVNLKYEKSAGGNEYLFELINKYINPDNISRYVEMVREQSLLRSFLLKMQEIQDQYSKGVADIGTFISDSNDAIAKIASRRNVGDMKSASEIALLVQDNLSRVQANSSGVTGVQTGFKKLDQMTHGWQKGDMIIVAARPSVGKTAFAMNLAYNAALKDQIPVAFFSLEMSSEKIMERLIASRALVDNGSIQTGILTNQEKAKISTAVKEISGTQLYFDDTPNSRLGDVVAKAKRLKKRLPNLGLIVIDYLGRIRAFDKADQSSRQVEVGYISGELKTLARNLDIPIIVLCQVNRAAEQNEGGKPGLASLRESGDIEQDADIVILLHRQDYFEGQGTRKKRGKDDPQQVQQPVLTKEERQSQGNLSEININIAKARNGQTGEFTLYFFKSYSRFDNPSQEYEDRKRAMEARARQAVANGTDFDPE